MAHQDRLNIAVFIDFDNIEIGVKSTLGEHFDVGTILEALKERGEVVTKIAYADWTRAGEYSRHLTQHAIRLVQRNLTPGGDKNGADINLALDALEMAFTHPHINAYVIVGGDSDFLSLVEKLKQYDKKVFVVGGRAFTSMILQRNCHEFIAYENLVRRPSARGGRPSVPQSTSPIAQAFPLVRRALKILADREVSPQTGLLKSTLLQLDSTFSERNYGASSFLDFAEKLAKEGIVSLKHSGRSVMVELNGGYADTAPANESAAETTVEPAAAFRPSDATPAPQAARAPDTPGSQPTESAAEGVARASRILAAAKNARWPMYLRNVKQILRQYRGEGAGANEAGGFDERRYGFGGLMDLLKALQREGVVRIERDRRGGLRVFQGAALQRVPGVTLEGLPRVDPGLEAELEEAELAEAALAVAALGSADAQLGEAGIVGARAPEGLDVVANMDDRPLSDARWAERARIEAMTGREPEPIDTTAELLGRAKARKPRTPASGRLPRAVGASAKRAAARKPSTRRSTRGKKPLPAGNGNNDDSQS